MSACCVQRRRGDMVGTEGSHAKPQSRKKEEARIANCGHRIVPNGRVRETSQPRVFGFDDRIVRVIFCVFASLREIRFEVLAW